MNNLLNIRFAAPNNRFSNRRLHFDSDYDIQRANEQFQRTSMNNLLNIRFAALNNRFSNRRLQFDSDYDIQRANEQFQRTYEEPTENVERSEASTPVQAPANGGETFYDKKTSFFDNISCESLEKTEGKNTRPDWKKERMTNQETFGHSVVRSLIYRRGPRGFVGGGYHRYQNQDHFSNYFNGGGNRNNYRNYHQNQQSQQQQRPYGGTFGAPPSGYHHRPYAGGSGCGGNKPNGW